MPPRYVGPMTSMLSRCSRVLVGLAVLFVSSNAHAALQVEGKPKVTFHAEGSPGALDIEGKTNALVLTDDGTTLTFHVRMETVDTGIPVRDHHMNEKYVETAKYPEVTLAVPKAAIPLPTATGEATNGTIKGTFTAHGVPQEVDVAWDVRKSKTGWRMHAKFPFDVQAHGIEIPSYLGVTVDPAMRAEATADVVDAP